MLVGVEVGVDVAVAVEVAVAVGVDVEVAVAVGVEVAVAVAVGVGLGGATTSSAPISGVVAERGSLSKSLVTAAMGVPRFATGEESEVKCRLTVAEVPLGLMSSGSTESEFVSRRVAACQLKRVV